MHWLAQGQKHLLPSSVAGASLQTSGVPAAGPAAPPTPQFAARRAWWASGGYFGSEAGPRGPGNREGPLRQLALGCWQE